MKYRYLFNGPYGSRPKYSINISAGPPKFSTGLTKIPLAPGQGSTSYAEEGPSISDVMPEMGGGGGLHNQQC